MRLIIATIIDDQFKVAQFNTEDASRTLKVWEFELRCLANANQITHYSVIGAESWPL